MRSRRRYFHSIDDGEIPLVLLFSGTTFTRVKPGSRLLRLRGTRKRRTGFRRVCGETTNLLLPQLRLADGEPRDPGRPHSVGRTARSRPGTWWSSGSSRKPRDRAVTVASRASGPADRFAAARAVADAVLYEDTRSTRLARRRRRIRCGGSSVSSLRVVRRRRGSAVDHPDRICCGSRPASPADRPGQMPPGAAPHYLRLHARIGSPRRPSSMSMVSTTLRDRRQSSTIDIVDVPLMPRPRPNTRCCSGSVDPNGGRAAIRRR